MENADEDFFEPFDSSEDSELDDEVLLD